MYIFDLEGNYTTAEVNYGNYIKDAFQAKKDVISIESMTLRVWVTDLKTSVFGHGIDSDMKPRRIINMIGLKEESHYWMEIIKDFTKKQSMFISPTSNEDLKRANILNQLNNFGEVLESQYLKEESKPSNNGLNLLK